MGEVQFGEQLPLLRNGNLARGGGLCLRYRHPVLLSLHRNIPSMSDLVLIDELPRSAIGKILKRELRDRYVGETSAI